MNSPLDCSLPRSRSAVLSSPGWPFYKKSFHLTAEAFLWWAIQGPNTHGLMNSPLDCSLPRSRSAVLSSPGWPFYKKSFHLTAEAFLWWAIQGPNTHGLMNSPLDCSSPRSRSAVLSSPAWYWRCPGVQRQRMKLLRLNRLHLWKSHRPPKKLRSRWKLLQLPNLRRQQPLRRHPNRHRPPRPRRQQSLRQSPPQNPRKPRWRKP